MAQFLNRLRHSFSPARIISFFQADIHDELLKRTSVRVLVLDQEVLNIETGQSAAIEDQSAKAIALAANKVVEHNKQVSIALFLGATEFAYTSYSLSGVSSSNVDAALGYQKTELFPANHTDLLLAVSHLDGEENKALWLAQQRAEDLFLELNPFNLLLTAVLPRVFLCVKGSKGSHSYREDASDYQLLCTFSGHSLSEWQLILKKDQHNKQFNQEWEQFQKRLPPEEITLLGDHEKWSEQSLASIRSAHYAFFPALAKQRMKKQSRLKTGRFSSFIIFILVVLLSLPFIRNEVRYNREEKKYLDYKEKTTEIRKMKSYVLNQQEVWAPFVDYPHSNLVEILELINKITPENSWLSTFNYKEGKIEIEGFSPNPTQLLQLMSAQEQFESVAFSQKIQSQKGKENERFGITMRLKNFNPDEFKKNYFPQE